jgi:hypothetical protein
LHLHGREFEDEADAETALLDEVEQEAPALELDDNCDLPDNECDDFVHLA